MPGSGSPIQVESRTDQSQMTESLRSISQLLPRPRDLLTEHPQMVPEAQHILKDVDGPRQILLFTTRAKK